MGKSKTKVRFAVTRNGLPRCIASVAENPDGTLIVDLRGSQLSSDIASPLGNIGEPIAEYRYTIHTSSESTQGVNTINLHKRLESGEALSPTPKLYTTAIKKDRNFALLYAKQCSSMVHAGYDIKKQGARYEHLQPTLFPQ